MASRWKLLKTLTLVTGCLVAAIAASCRAPWQTIGLRPGITLTNASLEIQVEPAAKPGEYRVSGTADLPEGTELTIAAIRYLQPSQAPVDNDDAQLTYSILAYDSVDIEGDRWQTQLSLWRVAPDGEFKEAWQFNEPDLELAVEPDDQVVFLVSLGPIYSLQAIEQQLALENRQFASQFIQTTATGSRYLQTSQVVAIDLPTGSTQSVGLRPEDINGGWGRRYLQLPDLPNTRELELPDNRQTNAPLTREELLY